MKKIVMGNMGNPMGLLAKMLGGGFSSPRIRSSSRPTDSRHWHNLNDQVQRDVLQAAEAKRERKAEKLIANASYSFTCNNAWDITPRLDPFHVNRGQEA